MSLRTRVVLLFTPLFVLLAGVAAVLAVRAAEVEARAALEIDARSHAVALAAFLGEAGGGGELPSWPAGARRDVEEVVALGRLAGVRVATPAGRTLLAVGAGGLPGEAAPPRLHDGAGGALMVATASIPGPGGAPAAVVAAAVPAGALAAVPGQVGRRFLAAGLLVVALAAAGAFVLGTLLSRRVTALERRAGTLGRGGTVAQVDAGWGVRELRELGRTFDTLDEVHAHAVSRGGRGADDGDDRLLELAREALARGAVAGEAGTAAPVAPVARVAGAPAGAFGGRWNGGGAGCAWVGSVDDDDPERAALLARAFNRTLAAELAGGAAPGDALDRLAGVFGPAALQAAWWDAGGTRGPRTVTGPGSPRVRDGSIVLHSGTHEDDDEIDAWLTLLDGVDGGRVAAALARVLQGTGVGVVAVVPAGDGAPLAGAPGAAEAGEGT